MRNLKVSCSSVESMLLCIFHLLLYLSCPLSPYPFLYHPYLTPHAITMPGPQISRLPSSGHVILHAQIWAAPGKESIIKEEALKIKKYTEENEKGSCLTYRVTEDIKDRELSVARWMDESAQHPRKSSRIGQGKILTRLSLPASLLMSFISRSFHHLRGIRRSRSCRQTLRISRLYCF